MNNTLETAPFTREQRNNHMRRISKYGMSIAQAVLLGLGSTEASAQDGEAVIDDQGAEVLTRGPVHEAFAGIVSYDPEPGVIVDRAPPEAIEEIPPSQRPEGDNVSWIPGYWSWDDESTDYLWVSGTWRALPPGREWTTGYWGEAGDGYQWTSGYWADATARETTYLPKPPRTVEVGPNIEAPSSNHVWSPGSWTWRQERYAWSPGYWAEGRPDWDWTPPHYVWTPRGHVHVNGYWDYSMDRRGIVYAPVRFQAGYHSRPGYQYSPVIAIGLAALVDHLFLRPSYQHYYFGDYYDSSYSTRGYYSPYAFRAQRFGYDPIYSYQRWSHRQDNDWERRYMASYDFRRDNVSSRPPRTWMDQRRLKMENIDAKDRQNYMMGTRYEDLAKQSDRNMRFQTVSANERQKMMDQSREVRKNRDQRRELEVAGGKASDNKSDKDFKPTKVQRSGSPIVGKSSDQFSGQQAPPKPRNDSNSDNNKDRSDPKNPDKDRSDPKNDKQNPRRDGDNKDKDKDKDSKPRPDQARDEGRQDQQAPRRDGDNKDKDKDSKPRPDQARDDGRQNQQAPRREVEPKPQQPERKAGPDRVRPETKQEQPPQRREVEPKAKQTERKEVNRNEQAAPNKAREQQSSGQKSGTDEKDSETTEEDKKKRRKQ